MKIVYSDLDALIPARWPKRTFPKTYSKFACTCKVCIKVYIYLH